MTFKNQDRFPSKIENFNDSNIKRWMDSFAKNYNSLKNLFTLSNGNGNSFANGLLSKTGIDANNNVTFGTSVITAGTGIQVTNGDGVAGNPTISFSQSGVHLGYPTQFPLEATNTLLGAPLMTFYKTNNASVTGTNTVLTTITIPSDLLQNGDGVVLKAKCATGAGGGTIILQIGGTTVFSGSIGTSITAMIEGETVLTSGAGAFTSIVCSTTSSTTAPSNLSRTTGTLASGLAATTIVIQTTGTFTLDMLTLIYNRGGSL